MGVKKRLVLETPPEAAELRTRLVEEWQRGEENDSEPVIIEERHPSQPTHLYVIWSDWPDLTIQERSEIIMDAYEEVYGIGEALKVSVALGVTPEEAERMRIKFP